jgi:hypothetical protein
MAKIQIPLMVADGKFPEHRRYIAQAAAALIENDIRKQDIICDTDEMGEFQVRANNDGAVIFETETDRNSSEIVEALMIIFGGLLFKASYKTPIEALAGKYIKTSEG